MAQDNEPLSVTIKSFTQGQKFTCITVDTNNNVWAGTKKAGLYFLDQKAMSPDFEFMNIEDEQFVLEDFEITSMAADSFGNLWVGHHGKGFSSAVQGGMERVDFNNPNDVKHFGTDADAKCLRMQEREGLATRRTNQVTVDKEGTVWSAHKWDNLTYTGEPYVQIIYGIPFTIPGGASITTPGAFSYKKAGWEKFETIGSFSNVTNQLPYPAYTCNPKPTEAPQGRIFQSIATNEHSVWVSIYPYTDEDEEFHPPQVQIYDRKSATYRGYFNFESLGLSGPGIFNGIYLSPDCGIAVTSISAKQGFIVSGNGQSKSIIKSTTHPDILPPDTRINSNAIWGNGYGNVFIGTDNGVLVYDGVGKFNEASSYKLYNSSTTEQEGFISDNILGGYSDRDSVQWIVTDNGIMRMVFEDIPPTIRVGIKLAEAEDDKPDKVEFWGPDGSFTKKISWDKEDDKKGLVAFSLLPCKEHFDITDMHLLKGDKLYGKSSFSYAAKNVVEGRKKEVVWFVHNDLVKYVDHPIEKDNCDWVYKNKFRYEFNSRIGNIIGGTSTDDGDFYQTSMLVMPINSKKKKYALSNIEKENTPVLFVHGLTGVDSYWGSDTDIIDPEDGEDPMTTSKKDYIHTSYPSKLKKLNDELDIWEYYFPSDQSWEESGYLLSTALQYIQKEYGKEITVVAHSMGGLVVRSYIEGTAKGYNKGGGTIIDPYSNEIEEVIFLATPHHGSFASTRLFFGLGLPSYVSEFASAKDNFSPAARDMSMGSNALMHLNTKVFETDNPKYHQISGTTYYGLIPEPLGFPVTTESWNNDDGVVSIGSGSLLNLQDPVPTYLLKGFSHFHLNSPDVPDGFEFSDKKTYVPSIINKIILGEEPIPNRNDHFTIQPEDKDLPEQIFKTEHSNQENDEKTVLNVCNPMVTFKKEDGSIWKPSEAWKTSAFDRFTYNTNYRFKLEVIKEGESYSAVLVQDQFRDPLNYNSPGLFLYFGGNAFIEDCDNQYKESINNSWSAFYPYRVGRGAFPNIFYPESALDPLGVRGKVVKLVEVAGKIPYKILTRLEDAKGKAELVQKFMTGNPLDFSSTPGAIQGLGVGWHLPENQELALGLNYTYKVYKIAGRGTRLVNYYRDYGDALHLKWGTTTYNTPTIPDIIIPVLNSGQHLDNVIPGSLQEPDFNLQSSEPVATSRNDITPLQNWVDCRTRATTFVLEYGENTEPSFAIIAPSGSRYTPTNLDDNSMQYYHNSDLKVKFITVSNPQDGLWKVEVDGKNELADESMSVSYPMEVENLARLYTPDSIALNNHIFYDSLLLETRLLDPSVSTSNLQTKGFLLRNDTTQLSLDFNDEGINGDKVAGDGIFSTFLYATQEGKYEITTNIHGLMEGCPFIRSAAFEIYAGAPKSLKVDAGMIDVFLPDTCLDKRSLKAVLANFKEGTTLEEVEIHWTLNGVRQETIHWKDTIQGQDYRIILLDTLSIVTGTDYEIAVWTENPNGEVDRSIENDTIVGKDRFDISIADEVEILQLADKYCIADVQIPLVASIEGGEFKGPGVSNNSLDLSAAGVGIHEITYALNTNGGCPSGTLKTVEIISATLDSFNYQVDSLEVNFQFVPPIENTTISWDFGNGNQSNNTNPTHIFNDFGTYDVCLTANTECGQTTNCQTIELSATNNQLFSLSGNIQNENKEAVEKVKVDIANESMLTGSDGDYNAFVLGNQNYTIRPSKQDGVSNGLSITDLLQVQAHILALKDLDSPYKLIAADVNNSGTITSSDLIEIQKVILGISTEFTHVPSWRFVPTSYIFSDPINPFASPIPDSIQVIDLRGVKPNLDFIAIKMGDVNLNATPNFQNVEATSRNKANWTFSIQDQRLLAGTEVQIPITSSQLINIIGFQMALGFESESIALLEVIPQVTKGFDFLLKKEELKLLWASSLGTAELASNTPLFQLRIRAKKDTWLSDILWLDKKETPSEVVDTQFGTKAINLIYTQSKEKPISLKIYPNPAKNQLQIEWSEKELSAEARIQVFNNIGQEVLSIEVKEAQQVALNISDLAAGIYFLKFHQNEKVGYGNFIKK